MGEGVEVKAGTGGWVAIGFGEGVGEKVGRGVGVSDWAVTSSVAKIAAVVGVSGLVASGGASALQAVNPNKLMVKKNIAKRNTFMVFPDRFYFNSVGNYMRLVQGVKETNLCYNAGL